MAKVEQVVCRLELKKISGEASRYRLELQSSTYRAISWCGCRGSMTRTSMLWSPASCYSWKSPHKSFEKF